MKNYLNGKRHPEHDVITSNKHKEYVKIVNEMSGGANEEEDDKNYKRIIKKVAAETTIDKNDTL